MKAEFNGQDRVLLLGINKALKDSGRVVEQVLSTGNFDQILLSITEEEVNGLREYIKSPVEVEMDDVEAHIAWPRDAHDGVRVGAVIVELAACRMYLLGNLDDVLVEEAERVGVRHHQRGDATLVMLQRLLQVGEIYAAARIGLQLDRGVVGQRSARGVSAMRAIGDEHDITLRVATALMIRLDDHQASDLAVRSSRWL